MKNALNPYASVIIPTYNRCWILKEAIDSVLSQRFSDFEIIVVDDGSTDATNALLSTYGDQVTTIYQKNKGVSAARNAGISIARGDYIAFLDSDDMWLAEKLSCQHGFFQSHPEAFICQTDEIWIRNGVRVNPKNRHKKPSGMIFVPSLQLCLVSPSAVMIKKSLFNAVGVFNESFLACEDYDLWLRIGLQYPIYLIDRQLVVKRGGHDDQLSRNPGLDRYRIQSIVNILENHTLTTPNYEAAVNVLKEKCRIYADGCTRRGKVEEAGFYQTIASRYPRECRDGHLPLSLQSL
ncbi:MAG: glycosyltransferase [Deltaproteobacteria bacterium]|nr:glycosyltransferase [Deltaproteobacteria bacterium]